MSQEVPKNAYVTRSDINHFLPLPLYTNLPLPMRTDSVLGESSDRSHWCNSSKVETAPRVDWGKKYYLKPYLWSFSDLNGAVGVPNS